MFWGCEAFNIDISGWDLSSVDDVKNMFEGASNFNQNLCAWRDDFPYDEADDIFKDSGCKFEDTPQRGDKGPFCASDCETQEIEQANVGNDPEQNESTCSVCPDGLGVPDDTVIPYKEANGASCKEMLGYSRNYDETSDECSQMKDAEAVCCPADALPAPEDLLPKSEQDSRSSRLEISSLTRLVLAAIFFAALA